MLYDVLTWVVHGGELYVLIIIIHGMMMLHVALIYAFSMKEYALASCISYARHIARHGCECMVGIDTALGV